jgi:hypothetical protein
VARRPAPFRLRALTAPLSHTSRPRSQALRRPRSPLLTQRVNQPQCRRLLLRRRRASPKPFRSPHLLYSRKPRRLSRCPRRPEGCQKPIRVTPLITRPEHSPTDPHLARATDVAQRRPSPLLQLVAMGFGRCRRLRRRQSRAGAGMEGQGVEYRPEEPSRSNDHRS